MFSIAALVPSPPILVPALCGGATRVTGADPVDAPALLRAAALEAAGALAVAHRWMVVGTGAADQLLDPDTLGTFRGFGVDTRVALSNPALSTKSAEDVPDPRIPLSALIAGWLRGQAAPSAEASARIVAADTSTARCAEIGTELRTVLDDVPEPLGVLIVADGAATLSTASPGYLDSRATAVQDDLDRALAAGDRAGLLALDPALCAELAMSGRAAYQVLAGLFAADPSDPEVETLYQDAPFGVGYQVSVWRPVRERGDAP
ncbi:hypothetical protein ACFQZZ_22735 [Nocardia sp. GCM10030253]|uniref:hypothetical protein n=1 Tax=Nocardia sp. GCM10030253 TaxID=3273404 RepID=UPI00362B0523